MIKKNIYLCNSIDTLDLDEKIINKLIENEIELVENIWMMNRKKLKDLGFTDNEIKQITIKLQLLGLDLNKRVYN